MPSCAARDEIGSIGSDWVKYLYYGVALMKKSVLCFLARIGHRSRQQPVSRVRGDELRRRERHRAGEGIQTLDHLSGSENHPSRLGKNCVS